MRRGIRPILWSLWVTAVGVGCAQPRTRIEVTRFSDPPQTYYQEFASVWFRKTAAGEFEILLESGEPVAERDILRQSVYIRVFWRPLPGKTYAEATQINAQVTYYMELSPPDTGQVVSAAPRGRFCHTGSGFVSLSLDRTGHVMRGRIEQATLEPVGPADDRSLGKMILSGTFRADRGVEPIAVYKVTRAKHCR